MADAQSERSGRGKRKAIKDGKDPNAPKRATTAFFFYSNEMRPNVRSQYPDAKVSEIAKLLGELWRGLTPAQKEKYTELAVRDRERYALEKKAYEEEHGGGGQSQGGKEQPKQERAKRQKKAEVQVSTQQRRLFQIEGDD